ncbi:sensor histidine kinase [Novosphingobium pokkalii]
MDIAPDLPLVMVDPRLFHHCLINLIENAVRHGGEEGAITLSAKRRPEGLDLMVLDEGPGLPPGMEFRVFEVFTRVEGSDRKGGTGLGLAIVKGFARAMGIAVSATNRTDHPGARFTLRFSESQLRKISPE